MWPTSGSSSETSDHPRQHVALDGGFVFVRGRRVALSKAANLGTVLRARLAESLDAARELFDAEVSFGSIEEDGRLEIRLSTLPWRVGDELTTRANIEGMGGAMAVSERRDDAF